MFRDRFSLQGKVAVVTGGSGGSGRAAARVFLEQGARLILTGRDPARLDEAATLLPPKADLLTIQGDMRDTSHIDEIVEAAAARGGVDVVANCVGIQRRMPLLEATAPDLERLWSVNMLSVFAVTQALLPQLAAKNYGKIINLCSIGSFVGLMDKTMYAITKGGLLQYTRSAAVELAPYGIRVNAIAPGFIDTPMTHHHIHSDREEEFLSNIPLRRFGTVEDLEPLFAYLASAASDHMTGQMLVLDGGETV